MIVLSSNPVDSRAAKRARVCAEGGADRGVVDGVELAVPRRRVVHEPNRQATLSLTQPAMQPAMQPTV